MKLDNVSTAELVEELAKREGVEKTIIAPYVEAQVSASGPAIVFVVID